MEKSIKDQIDRLQQKLQLVIKKMHNLERENETHKKQMESLRQENALIHEKSRRLEEQNFVLKASSGSMHETDKKEFEQAINKYIREIDKCIGLLNE